MLLFRSRWRRENCPEKNRNQYVQYGLKKRETRKSVKRGPVKNTKCINQDVPVMPIFYVQNQAAAAVSSHARHERRARSTGVRKAGGINLRVASRGDGVS
jgi:hypothetical protein